MPTLDELRAQALAVNEQLKKAELEDAKKMRVYNTEEFLAGSAPGESPDSMLPNLYNPDLEVRPKTGYRKSDVVRDRVGTKLVGDSAKVFDIDTLIEKAGPDASIKDIVPELRRHRYEMQKNPHYKPDGGRVESWKILQDIKYPGTKLPPTKGEEEVQPMAPPLELVSESETYVPKVTRPGLPKASPPKAGGLFTESKSDSKKPKKK